MPTNIVLSMIKILFLQTLEVFFGFVFYLLFISINLLFLNTEFSVIFC